ncbi:MAG: 30S ribosomal protein S2 [Candidatus Kerfeldbacteria bacterium]|nr:30S ribosomal protein S2 [Candidatus Kerfeldbacteria bacterium]
MQNIDISEMLEAGVHFGHQPSRWHPNMKPYIFTVRNGVQIIDLEKTKTALERALEVISKATKDGKNILFVGTKRQAKEIVKKYASEAGVFYFVERWVGGFLTNFDVVSRSIRRLRDLKLQRDTGELSKYTKKEQLNFSREIEKLSALFSGVERALKTPDLLVILSAREEKTALREARRMKIPIIAVCDTNTDPTDVEYPIPANDDAIKAIEYIMKRFVGAIAEGKAQAAAPKPEEAAKPKSSTFA